MKITLLITTLLISTLTAGCAMKFKLLDAGAVSMTKTSLPEGSKLTETGPVQGRFCANTFKDKGSFGLMDMAVKQAQADANVDYIMNASFWAESGCLSVEGTGAKVVAAGSSPETSKSKKKK